MRLIVLLLLAALTAGCVDITSETKIRPAGWGQKKPPAKPDRPDRRK